MVGFLKFRSSSRRRQMSTFRKQNMECIFYSSKYNSWSRKIIRSCCQTNQPHLSLLNYFMLLLYVHVAFFYNVVLSSCDICQQSLSSHTCAGSTVLSTVSWTWFVRSLPPDDFSSKTRFVTGDFCSVTGLSPSTKDNAFSSLSL